MASDCNLNRCLQRLCIPATDWKCSNSTRSGFSFTVGPLPPQAEQCLKSYDWLCVSLTYSHTCQQQAHQVRHLTWRLWDRVFKTRTYISCVIIPALTSLTAQSPGLTPFRSPSSPIHRVAATGFPVVFRTWTAHSASSTCSKYWNKKQTSQSNYYSFKLQCFCCWTKLIKSGIKLVDILFSSRYWPISVTNGRDPQENGHNSLMMCPVIINLDKYLQVMCGNRPTSSP